MRVTALRSTPVTYHPFFGAALAIGGVMVASWILRTPELQSGWRMGAVAVAVVPSAYLMFVMYRWLGALDEMQRRIQVEALGIAFTGSMLGVLTLEYPQKAGFASGIGWERGWEGMGILYILSLLLVCRRYA